MKGRHGRPKPHGQALRGGRLKVFISHAGADLWIARQMATEIHRRGAGTFLDDVDIERGDAVEERMRRELNACSEMVVLLTPDSVQRPYIWLEIGGAWLKRKRVVGVLYGLSAEDLKAMPRVPAALKNSRLVSLNEFEKYLRELGGRVTRARAKRARSRN